MATKRVKRRSKAKRTVRITMPREARAAYGEIQKGVDHLDKSIAELRSGLLRAERQIEADARRRIRELRTEARTQLKGLQVKQRDAARLLKKLSAAAGESWREIKRSADSLIAEARAAAAAVGKRFRSALKA
jgi:ElaB/YqjD/DUF883 family membrane-anchored ribosome-binding protein